MRLGARRHPRYARRWRRHGWWVRRRTLTAATRLETTSTSPRPATSQLIRPSARRHQHDAYCPRAGCGRSARPVRCGEMWKRGYGKATWALSDERDGNRQAKPAATVPHPNSIALGPIARVAVRPTPGVAPSQDWTFGDGSGRNWIGVDRIGYFAATPEGEWRR